MVGRRAVARRQAGLVTVADGGEDPRASRSGLAGRRAMIDFHAEREKRRAAAQQRELTKQSVERRAIASADDIVESLNRDLNADRSENINVSRHGRRVSLKMEEDYLHVEVKDDLSYDLTYKYGQKDGYLRSTVDSVKHANTSAELAGMIDAWRGIVD